MANLDQTTRRVMEDNLMPAAKNLLGNRGSSEVRQLLAAGENATPQQKKKIAEKYLKPFFAEGSEYGDILLDEVLKIASDQAKLDVLERALSGSPVNASIDFNPNQFIEKAARQMTGNYEGTDRPSKEENLEAIMSPPPPELPTSKTVQTAGTTKINKRNEIQISDDMPIPPPLPPIMLIPEEEGMEIPEGQTEDYIGDQVEGSKAKSQPSGGSSPQTTREAKKEGLDKDKKRKKAGSYQDEAARNVQEQQKIIAAEIAREAANAAAEAVRSADEAKKNPKGIVQKLKHPAAMAGLMTGAATLTIGGILGLDYGVNTLFS